MSSSRWPATTPQGDRPFSGSLSFFPTELSALNAGKRGEDGRIVVCDGPKLHSVGLWGEMTASPANSSSLYFARVSPPLSCGPPPPTTTI